MGATGFDFNHFVTTAQIARRVRGASRVERRKRVKYLKVKTTWKAEVTDAINKGRFEDVIRHFEQAIETETDEAYYLDKIILNEEVFMYDEVKAEAWEEELQRNMMDVSNKLLSYDFPQKSEIQAFLSENNARLNAKMAALNQHVRKATDQVTRILIQLQKDDRTILKTKTLSKTFTTARGTFTDAKRKANAQVKDCKLIKGDLKFEYKGIKLLYKYLDILKQEYSNPQKKNLPEAVRAKDNALKLLRIMYKRKEEIIDHMMKSADEYLDIIEDALTAYIDTFADGKENFPEVLRVMKSQSYPDKQYKECEQKAVVFFKKLSGNVEKLASMARFDNVKITRT